MSEAQAIETDDEIEIEDTEIVDQGDEVEEVEIVVEGEEKPSSEPARISGFAKRVNKLNGKIETANQEAEEARRRAEALEEENKLLRLKAGQETLKRPKPDDFDSDAEYDAALDAYDEQRLTQITDKRLKEVVDASQAHTTQSNQNALTETQLKAHYERAGEFKVKDYEETEDKAIDILGRDTVKQIMVNTDNSPVILYHLGKNPGKAEKLADLIASNPMKGVLEIGRLEASLKVKPKSKTPPDPEEQVDSGSSVHDIRGPKGATYE